MERAGGLGRRWIRSCKASNQGRKFMAGGHYRESGHGPSQRQLRAGELVRHAMAEILVRGDVHDPVIETHLITVPEVRMTPDLRAPSLYLMPLGAPDAMAVLD